LGSAAGWSRVRVTHSKPDDDEGALLGLERLADLPPNWERGARSTFWPFERLRMPRPGSDGSAYIVGFMVVFGLIFAGVLWHVMSDGGGPQLVLRAPEHTSPPRFAPAAHSEAARPSTRQPVAAGAQASSPASQRQRRSPSVASATQAAAGRWLARWTDGAAQWAVGRRSPHRGRHGGSLAPNRGTTVGRKGRAMGRPGAAVVGPVARRCRAAIAASRGAVANDP
jgi:hypothetical protein